MGDGKVFLAYITATKVSAENISNIKPNFLVLGKNDTANFQTKVYSSPKVFRKILGFLVSTNLNFTEVANLNLSEELLFAITGA